MRTWLIIIASILFVVFFVITISYLGSVVILKVASKYMDELNDSYSEKILKLLPKTNCKECGRDDCDEYVADVLQKTNNRMCPYCNDEINKKIEDILLARDKEIEELKKHSEEANRKSRFQWKRRDY